MGDKILQMHYHRNGGMDDLQFTPIQQYFSYIMTMGGW